MRCWPFGVARAHFNVTSSARRPSTFLTHSLSCHTPQDQHASKVVWMSERVQVSSHTRARSYHTVPVYANAIMAIESNSAHLCSVYRL
jgi:hypothetical protein